MAEIIISTRVNSTIDIVFDLSRSIELHEISTSKTGEEAVVGVTSGLMNLDERVTWKARHLFKQRNFTSKSPHLNVLFISVMRCRREILKNLFTNIFLRKMKMVF